MSQNTNPSPSTERYTYVSTHEPIAKPPPLLETGALHWIYANLFSSVLNTVLTIVGFLIVVLAVVSFFTWSIQEANWFAISFNFRSFMLGRFEAQYEWRTSIAVLFVIFVAGMTIAVWVKQAARAATITMIVILIAVWVLPPVVTTLFNLPSWYTAAGTRAIQSGSATETAEGKIAFIGRAGEEIRLSFASDLAQNDATLGAMSGFGDVASNTLRNAAINRLVALEAANEVDARLAEHESSTIPILTASQYETLKNQAAQVVLPEQVIGAYGINQSPVAVQIYRAVKADDALVWEFIPLRSEAFILDSAAAEVTFNLTEDSWYILEKVPVDPATSNIGLIEVEGIYPLFQSTSYVGAVNGFVDTFIRMTDNYRTQEILPRENGTDIPPIFVTRNQYRGIRPVTHFLRTYIAPFFARIAFHTSLVMLFGVLGYVAIQIGNQLASDKKLPSRVAAMGLMLSPVVIWILINGVTIMSALAWLMFAGVVVISNGLNAFGRTMGRQRGLPLTIVTILVIYGLSLSVFWTATDGGLARYLLIFLTPFIMGIMALLGMNAYVAKNDSSNSMWLNLGIGAAFYFLAFILLRLGIIDTSAEWGLSPTDPRGWGGLLLTMMLTIFGIIAAFPIGIGLALGRRSNLPLIKYLCTGYIELVRGSPFVTVLFFMQLFIPLINDTFASIPGAYRALVAVILFSAAYLAENVRGGLQSLPPGQNEAAKALGLNVWQAVTLITLPQALRAVIPALVGQFISLFKDTSLVAVVGLIDITGFVNTMVVQAEFIGTRQEGLLFISLLYFGFSYVMGYISRLLEASGSGVTRRLA